MDAPNRSPWTAPETVAGFAKSPPNETLVRFAAGELQRSAGRRLLDIGCGAGRNAVPLAALGWTVLGVDLSGPMLAAARQRAADEGVAGRVHVALASMDALPARDGQFDLIVAHGIWNLAGSAGEFRQAAREGARVAAPGAALFVFTFSRNTLPAEARPVDGEPFVFTGFSGRPHCFLTESQLLSELRDVGFVPDPAVPLAEHNLPRPGVVTAAKVPVIYEAAFRYRGK
jgi:SAM-dependent methyltransferase